MAIDLTHIDVAALGLSRRDFLKESDFTAAELTSLIELAEGTEGREEGHRRATTAREEEHRAHLRKVLDPDALRVRGCCSRPGRRTTYLDPQSSQLGHKDLLPTRRRC